MQLGQVRLGEAKLGKQARASHLTQIHSIRLRSRAGSGEEGGGGDGDDDDDLHLRRVSRKQEFVVRCLVRISCNSDKKVKVFLKLTFFKVMLPWRSGPDGYGVFQFLCMGLVLSDCLQHKAHRTARIQYLNDCNRQGKKLG